MPLEPESLYRQLGQLIADMPANLPGPGPITPEIHQWLGRAASLIHESVEINGKTDIAAFADSVSFTSACDGLASPLLREDYAHKLLAILHRTFFRVEIYAPATAQGAFIPVGAVFTALQAIGKVLGCATHDVLIVDPYMDATVLTDFAPLAPEGARVRLLTDSFYTKATTMQPSAARWVQEYGSKRPLETRFTAPRALHDRLIVTDDAHVWSLTQSLKDFSARSPASVVRVEPEIAKLKADFYGQAWATAQPLP